MSSLFPHFSTLARRARVAALVFALACAAVAASASFALAAGVPTLTAPAASSTVSGSILLTYSLPEAPVAGSVTVTFTGTTTTTLTLAGSSQTGSFTFPAQDPTSVAQVASVTGAASIAGGAYGVTLAYQSSVDTFVASTTNTNVTVDRNTDIPTLTSPFDSTTYNVPQIEYVLPEAPLSGSAALTFTAVSGPVTRTLMLTDSSASQPVQFTLNPASPTSSPSVASIVGGSSIPDGTYTVTLSYRDAFGNPASTDSVFSVTIDTVTLTPTLVSPASGASIANTVAVAYTLPEVAQASSVKLTFTGTNTYVLTIAGAGAGSHQITFSPADPAATAGVLISGGAAIVPGTYSVTVGYVDALGNPRAASTAATAVVVVDTTPATPITPAPTPAATVSGLTGAKKIRTAKAAIARQRKLRRECKSIADSSKRRKCNSRAALKPPTFKLDVTDAGTLTLSFATKRGASLTVPVTATAAGQIKVKLTRSQWRKLRAGRTTVTALLGISTSTFSFTVR
jgi:hypothetical protein